MHIHFYKYQGTGNDFIILDNRENMHNTIDAALIKKLCDRHFGIGADGLMILNTSTESDFDMKYYNSDGNESTMCGNGGRCMAVFAKDLGIIDNHTTFHAIDGKHEASIRQQGEVELKMSDIDSILIKETYFQLNSGSPHYVHFTEGVADMDIKKEGALIRNSPVYKEEGINVNFVERLADKSLFVRTYERGVEDETLSCGTGVVACAISSVQDQIGVHEITVKTLGGSLLVKCTNIDGQHFNQISLSGQAGSVFNGVFRIV